MIYLDTNVILDILDEKREGHSMAMTVLAAIEAGAITASCSSQSILDAAYVQNQTMKVPVELVRKALAILSDLLEILSITKEDLMAANMDTFPDYEDAAHLACARRNQCQTFVTNDKKIIREYTGYAVSLEHYYHTLFS